MPDFEVMTGGRFGAGLIGCVHQLTIQGEEVNLATDVQAAANVSPCTDYADSGSVARPGPPPAPSQYTWIWLTQSVSELAHPFHENACLPVQRASIFFHAPSSRMSNH